MGNGGQTNPMFASFGSALYRTDSALADRDIESFQRKPLAAIHIPNANSTAKTSTKMATAPLMRRRRPAVVAQRGAATPER